MLYVLPVHCVFLAHMEQIPSKVSPIVTKVSAKEYYDTCLPPPIHFVSMPSRRDIQEKRNKVFSAGRGSFRLLLLLRLFIVVAFFAKLPPPF